MIIRLPLRSSSVICDTFGRRTMQSNATTHNQKFVDVLIITALPEERDAVLHQLEDFSPTQVGKSPIYYTCTLPTNIGECKVAVTQLSQMGNVSASIHATKAIDEMDPKYVLMVGIAAGIKSRVNRGDVVVCSQVLYYEQAKQTSTGAEYRPISINADPILLQTAQNYNDSNWCSLIVTKMPQFEGTDSPRVYFGPFAVGDKVVADQNFISSLMKLHPKIIGIEMESYGVAEAAAEAYSRPRFLAIRGISDFADEQKDDSFRQYASSAAAAYTVGFLQACPLFSNALSPSPINTLLERPGTFVAIRHLSREYIPPQTIVESLPPEFADQNVIELPIDQTDLYSDGRLSDPLKAARQLTNLEHTIDSILSRHPNTSMGYFGIAHIPLLFYIGRRLSNKRKLHFYELNRFARRWDYLHGDGEFPELEIESLPTQINKDQGDILVRISISNTVTLEEVAEIVPSPIASLHLCLVPTKRDVMVSEHQLQDYGAKFRQLLDHIHEFFPNREQTHIFYAGPVSLAVYFGQLIIQTIDRKIVVYNYTEKDSPRYSWGLKVTDEADSPGFLVLTQK